jgi:hypothetical protein
MDESSIITAKQKVCQAIIVMGRLLSNTKYNRSSRRHHHQHGERTFPGGAQQSLFFLVVTGLIYWSFTNTSHFSRNNASETLLASFSAAGRVVSTDSIASRSSWKKQEKRPYKPSPVESYIVNHTVELGFDAAIPPKHVVTCHIWKDPTVTPYHKELHTYLTELQDYENRVRNFQLPAGVKDVRQEKSKQNNDNICDTIDLRLPDIFHTSQQLSTSVGSGSIEPLLPPMRHPQYCLDEAPEICDRSLVNITYLIHDFAHLCRQMTPSTRTIFVDMGASLTFHRATRSPAMELLLLYQKFGIQFDHIYAYEIKQADPNTVFNILPEEFHAAFHWINVGVETDVKSIQNPWKMLLDNYNPDDLIVVKLDIDTPALEKELAHQLLHDERLQQLVDHFYFEHHVNQKELGEFQEFQKIKERERERQKVFFWMRQK